MKKSLPLSKKDLKEITLLPYYFNTSLKNPKELSEDILVDLGTANLHGWLAYRTYDNILDNEGSVSDLPLANISLREVTCIYLKLLPRVCIPLFSDIMDGIERANLWEREHCYKSTEKPDYGNYQILADKSLGHALGPIAILAQNGYTPHSPEIEKTISFFTHYIIARQLNDDAHDWASDLERGFVNSASALFEHIATKKETLQETFWKVHIDTIAQNIFFHITKAREELITNHALGDLSYLKSLLAPIERSAQKALIEKKQMLEFLKAY